MDWITCEQTDEKMIKENTEKPFSELQTIWEKEKPVNIIRSKNGEAI